MVPFKNNVFWWSLAEVVGHQIYGNSNDYSSGAYSEAYGKAYS